MISDPFDHDSDEDNMYEMNLQNEYTSNKTVYSNGMNLPSEAFGPA